MNAYTAITAAPLVALADQIKLLNDRERLLLIDWLADGFDDPELTYGLFEAIAPCFAKAEEVLPDNQALDYPSHARRPEPWRVFKVARDERLNLRLGAGK